MGTWLPSIIEAIVFLCSLMGVIIKTSNRIKELETKQDIIEKLLNDNIVNVTAIQSSFVKIETALARIETDILWIKESKKNEQQKGN
jgi:hypothetical protein